MCTKKLSNTRFGVVVGGGGGGGGEGVGVVSCPDYFSPSGKIVW